MNHIKFYKNNLKYTNHVRFTSCSKYLLNFTLSLFSFFFPYKKNNSGSKIQAAWLENGSMGSIRLSHLLFFQDIHVRHLPLSPVGSHDKPPPHSIPQISVIYLKKYIFVYILLYCCFPFFRRQDPPRGHGH